MVVLDFATYRLFGIIMAELNYQGTVPIDHLALQWHRFCFHLEQRPPHRWPLLPLSILLLSLSDEIDRTHLWQL